MPYFIAMLETIDPQKDAEILEEHKIYLQHHIDIGLIYAKGPFSDHSGGLIVLKAESELAARTVMNNDPVIKHKSRKMIFKQWKATLED